MYLCLKLITIILDNINENRKRDSDQRKQIRPGAHPRLLQQARPAQEPKSERGPQRRSVPVAGRRPSSSEQLVRWPSGRLIPRRRQILQCLSRLLRGHSPRLSVRQGRPQRLRAVVGREQEPLWLALQGLFFFNRLFIYLFWYTIKGPSCAITENYFINRIVWKLSIM